MANLLIEDIDIALLEKQRQALGNLLSNLADQGEDYPDMDQCEGLLNMLDYWSSKTFLPVKVRVREWFDKVNGNSYFSARLWVEDCLVVVLPFQYGYDDHGVSEAVKTLASYKENPSMKPGQSYWRYCEENQMKLEYYKEENCLKRDVKAWGERE